jgi:uncharacterized DUF497 family protein
MASDSAKKTECSDHGTVCTSAIARNGPCCINWSRNTTRAFWPNWLFTISIYPLTCGVNLRATPSAVGWSTVFCGCDALLLDDQRHSQQRRRYHALGVTAAGRRLHASFTLRRDNTAIRVISARHMSSKERAVYEQAPKDDS